MLIGEYNHTIDIKGRMALPVKFRQVFKNGAVITKGLDNCLFVYPKKDWQTLAEKLVSLPISQAKTRAFARFMLAGAMDVNLDKQGRINFPEYLLGYANLKKQAVVTGLYNRLEIWSDKEWSAYKKKTEPGTADIAEELGGIGI